jgi:excinuclease ABC subunit B
MQRAIDETNRRRAIQEAYNTKHGITPTTIIKNREAILGQTSAADSKRNPKKYYTGDDVELTVAADPVVAYMNVEQLAKLVKDTRKKMEKAAKDLDFMEAARLRDEMLQLEKMLKDKE